MERITKRIDETHACYAVCEKECPDGIYKDNPACKCTASKMATKRLLEYEDTGLTPEQIMELKGAVQRLDKIFGDEITVNQVIDFFVDFYIAQGDPDRVEAAELLTNEEVTRYRELKERDTPHKIELNVGGPICPVCGRRVVKCYDFCPDCGQRLEQ